MTLIDWINEHDCGVTPTGVVNPDGSITIRVSCTLNGQEVGVDSTVVRTLAEAHDALGY